MTGSRGFTLLEAMIVMLVVGVLLAAALPNFGPAMDSSKVRKHADLTAQTLRFAKESALNSNTTVYLSVQSGNLCLSKISATGCDLRSDPLPNTVSLLMQDTSGATPATITSLSINGVYGNPTPKDVTIKVSAGSKSQSVNMNLIGIVSTGDMT